MPLKSVHHSGVSGTAATADNRVINLNVSRAERDYFKTPSMETLLQALIDSISDARNVTVVSGVPGSGKSTLVDCLNDQARADWNICRIHARHAIGEKHILEYLNSFFHSEENLDLDRLSASMVKPATRRPVIIIDDADKLTTFALDTLFKLKMAVENQRGQLAIVLFAQPTIRPLLASPSLQRYDAIVRTIDLPALTSEQTVAYIERWLEVQGYKNALLLSPAQIQTLHKRSGGLPGRLNGLLEQCIDKQGQQNGLSGTAHGALPVVSGLVATSIAIGLVIVVIFWSLTEKNDDSAPVAPADRVSQSVPLADKTVETDNAEVATSEDGPATARDVMPPTQAVIAKPVQKGRDATVSPTSDKVGQQKTDTMAEAPDKRTSTAQAKPQATTQTTSTSLTPTMVEQERSESVSKVTSIPSKPAVQQQSAEMAQTSAGQTDNAAGEPPQSADIGQKQDGQAWLQAQSGEYYTVQLAASLDSDAIERFIKSQPDLPELHYVHIKQRNRDWYISLYGSYSDLALAQKAVNSLPESMRKNSPWIRRLAKLQSLVPDEAVSTVVIDTDAAGEIPAETREADTAATTTPDTAPAADDSAAAVTEPAAEAPPNPARVSPPLTDDGSADLVLPPVLE